MYEEKRKSVRVKKTLTLQYCSDLDKAKGIWTTAMVRDISEGGISFVADRDFLPDEILDLRIKFPFNPFEWTELKGRNVYSQGLKVGLYIIHIEFIDVPEEQKRQIGEYISKISNKGYKGL